MNFLYSVYTDTQNQKRNYNQLVRNVWFTNFKIQFTIISAEQQN